MALPLGPDFHFIGLGGEWRGGVGEGRWSIIFLTLAGKKRCREVQQLDCAKGARWRLSSRAGGRGFGHRAPPSFVQLRILRVQAIRCKPAGRGTRGSRPAPPRRAALPRIVPRGWGEEAARPRPAPPHPPRRRKAPRGPPVRSPCGSRPRRRPPPPRQERRGQGGGPAYRDMRNALLALVRHGPPLAPSARPVDLWGWLSPCLAVSRSRSPRAR